MLSVLLLTLRKFSVQFRKGKTYLEERYGVIPFLSEKNFNPAGGFIIYLELVAKLHANQNSLHDYLFPNIVIKKGIEYLCDRPVAYNYFSKLLKVEASLAHLSCAALKLSLHSLRRGPVTKAVNAGTLDFNIQKLMRFSSLADHQFLLQNS